MNARKRCRVSEPLKSNFSLENILSRRELGLKQLRGVEDYIFTRIFSGFDKFVTAQAPRLLKCENDRKYGGVFNLEFSTDGRLLAAACEEKSILLYDTSTQNCIKTLPEAHSNCVNCITFLDNHNFASCSDDASIKLWDLRYLQRPFKTFNGHANWVKNIEYCGSQKTLITSAFDGSVFAWDLKDTSDVEQPRSNVLFLSGIMRTKISPDESKMVISTTGGFMLLIHDLNIGFLESDFKCFKPDLYRLMQLTEQNFPAGNICNYLFHPSRRRNRVEFIDDFPNKAELISSLKIHPHGWSALSRNINSEESEDYTCVHDIQVRDISEYENYIYVNEQSELTDSDGESCGNRKPSDLWMGFVTTDQYDEYNISRSLGPMSSMNSGLIGKNGYKAFLDQHPEHRDKIFKNIPRLTHYVQEKNVGRGYIKEVCFSPDGRTICSPYDKGIRILGFNKNAQELTYCSSDEPKELCTLVEMNNYHKHVVVCCKFNPVDMQLVSGCLGGDIVWYKPFI